MLRNMFSVKLVWKLKDDDFFDLTAATKGEAFLKEINNLENCILLAQKVENNLFVYLREQKWIFENI